MSRKYKITTQSIEWGDKKLFRIQAVKSFGDVKVNDLGGYIENEKNLSQDGNSWVYNTAKVYDKAMVWGNAEIHDNAKIYDTAFVYGNAEVFGNAKVYGNVIVCDNAKVFGNAIMNNDGWARGYAEVY